MSNPQKILNASKTSDTKTLVLKVIEWRNNNVLGKSLIDDGDITVKLETTKKTAATQQTLSEFKVNIQCDIGTIPAFENAHPVAGGTWEARWCNVIKRSENDYVNSINVMKTRSIYGQTGNGRKYITALMIPNTQPTLINSIDDLLTLTKRYISVNSNPKSSGVSAYIELIIHRNKNDNIADGKTTTPTSHRITFREQPTKLSSGEVEWRFMTDPSSILNKAFITNKLIEAALNDPLVTITGLMGFKSFFGKKTTEGIAGNNYKLDRIKRDFIINSNEQHQFSNIGFKDAVIGVHYDDFIKSKYMVQITPLNNKTPSLTTIGVFDELIR